MIEQSLSLREKAANGGRWTAVSAITSVILQIAQLAILGRLLEPSDFGLMAMMLVVIGLTNTIADFGLGNYLVQKDKLSRKTLIRLLLIVTGLAILLSLLVALSSSLIADYYNQPSLVELLPWLSLSIIVFTISQMLMSVLQRFFAFRPIAVGEILSASLTLLSTTTLALMGYGIWSLVVGQIVAGATRLFIFAIPVVVRVRQLDRGVDMELLKVKSFVFYQTGERALNYLGWNLDKVIIGRILGDVGLGLYSVAYQLMIRPFSVLNPIFTRVALPLFVNIREDDVRLAAGYLQTLKIIALLSFPVYMTMAIGAPAIIQVLMGEKWGATAPILFVLSFLGFFFSIGNPIGTLILAKGKPKWAFYLNIISLVVYVVAFWIGSHYSALGVATAFLLSGAIVLYPMEFYLRYKLIGMTASQYFSSMRHLFIAAGVPLLIHSLVYLPSMKADSIATQSFTVLLAMVFFLSYLFIFDRNLIDSTKNLILKGK